MIFIFRVKIEKNEPSTEKPNKNNIKNTTFLSSKYRKVQSTINLGQKDIKRSTDSVDMFMSSQDMELSSPRNLQKKLDRSNQKSNTNIHFHDYKSEIGQKNSEMNFSEKAKIQDYTSKESKFNQVGASFDASMLSTSKNAKNGVKSSKHFLKPITPRTNILIKFEHFSSRPPFFEEENPFAPIYYPNVNYCKRRNNRLCLPFEKVSGRYNSALQRAKAKNKLVYSPPVLKYKKSPKSFDHLKPSKTPQKGPRASERSTRGKARTKKARRISSLVALQKLQPRVRNPNSVLPCFMQRGNGSRLSMKMVNEKALAENCYGDSEGKGKIKLKRRRRRRKEEDDESSEDSISDCDLFEQSFKFKEKGMTLDTQDDNLAIDRVYSAAGGVAAE